ncbi:MAG: ABC transporter permease [Candidatus Margulisiibacteriota bacterium]
MASLTSRRGIFSRGAFCITILFFYLPLSVLTLFSFNASKTMSWSGFSLRWYQDLFFNSPPLWSAFAKSIGIALASSVASTVIGTLGAIGLYWYSVKYKKALRLITFLPLLLPEIILGVALLIFFAGVHIELGLMTIFIAHTSFNIPYVFLILLARLEEFDYSIIEAAYDLGARERDVLLRVTLPMCFPAIMAGFLISLTLSLEDFVITFFVAGPGSTTLPLYIYSMIRFGVSPVINALSVVLIAGTILFALSTVRFYKYFLRK